MLKSIFAPLTTDKGHGALQAYLAGLPSVTVEETGPATLHELMHLNSQPEARRRVVAETLENLRTWYAAHRSGLRARVRTQFGWVGSFI